MGLFLASRVSGSRGAGGRGETLLQCEGAIEGGAVPHMAVGAWGLRQYRY